MSMSQLCMMNFGIRLLYQSPNVGVWSCIPKKATKHFSISCRRHQQRSYVPYFNALVPYIIPACETRQYFSTSSVQPEKFSDYLEAKDKEIFELLSKDMRIIPDFLSEGEETSLLDEVDKYMKRLRYEFDHWDNAIHGFRETEKKSWNNSNTAIIERVKSVAFSSEVSPLAYVHVLDIAKEGYIKPHVDAVRFCGDTIAGMSLLSSCVMRLALETDQTKYGDVYLPQRSLYIMKGKARYQFTHEVLKEGESVFNGQSIPRDRRISVICRNEPDPADLD